MVAVRSLMLAVAVAVAVAVAAGMPAAPSSAAEPVARTRLARLQTEALTAKLDAGTPGWLKAYAVAGAGVALIRDGKVIWSRAYGLADVASARPMTTDTVFNVGSLSKTVTAWGVMKLVEQGRVDLDQPADTYLKRWHLPPSQFDNTQVTVRRLLSHTSGISNHGHDHVVDFVHGVDRLVFTGSDYASWAVMC